MAESANNYPYAVVNTVVACTASRGAPYRATKRVRGVPKFGGRIRKQPLGPSVEFSTAPRSAWEVCRNRCGGRMRTQPLGPSVELPTG
eukprot:9477567-Pyramimonas_sp.AAC.1